MNIKERGYIFQDIFTSFIAIDKINEELKGKNNITKLVLDKKRTINDKFDDLKIIENSNIIEIQIKYSEKKEQLEYSDFVNFSGVYNLYQFILSQKGEEEKYKNHLIISMSKNNIENELFQNLVEDDTLSFLPNSKQYKFKITDTFINELYNKRISKKSKKGNIYESITKEHINNFLKQFTIELTSLSVLRDEFKRLVINKIDKGIHLISNVENEVIFEILINTIREYRAEDDYREVAINTITNKILKELNLSRYVKPINNEIKVDMEINLNRDKDILNTLGLLENNNIVYVYGAPGVGKSWFSKQLADFIKIQGNKVSNYYFYFNSEDFDRKRRLNRINFLTTFNYQLQKLHGYNVSLFNLKIEDLKLANDKEKHYIILDGIDHILREKIDENKIIINELITKLQEFSEKNQHIKIILISQHISDINIENKYELNKFSKDEVDIILNKYALKYNLNIDILKNLNIYDKTRGNPLLIKYLVSDFINNGTILDCNFEKLDDYYELIFSSNQFVIYSYFAIIDFPISVNELSEISQVKREIIEEEINKLKNILVENESNEYIVFHESMKRFINEKQIINMNELINKTILWLDKQDIYMNTKAFNYLPIMIINYDKYDNFNKEFDCYKIMDAIIKNGYSKKEVDTFINRCYKIFSTKGNFKAIYFLEHFADIYRTYLYEVDVDVFENYIYILYYQKKFDLLKKILYSRGVPEYSNTDQQWEYISKICIFLMKNKFKMKYSNITNVYFENLENTIKFDDIILGKDNNCIKFMIEYIKLNIDRKVNLLSQIKTQDEDIAKFLKNYFNKDTTEFLESFMVKDIFIKNIESITIDSINDKYKNKENEYIGGLDYEVLIAIFKKSIYEITSLISNWEKDIPYIPSVYKFLCEFIKILIDENTTENEYVKFFNKYNYDDINFQGYISSYNSELFFIGNLITKSNLNEIIINEFIKFKNRITQQRERNSHDGIVPLLGQIYSEIINSIKYNSIKLNLYTIEQIKLEIDPKDSNSTKLRNNMDNYLLYLCAGIHNENIFSDIINLMFSYGSYRDIQIWELENILDKLIETDKIDIDIFIDLMLISFNAINIMDRAKDVWQVPNELLKKYCDKVSPIEALSVFFSMYEMSDYDIREEDDVFCYIYEKLNLKTYRKNELLYNYWNFIQRNMEYAFSDNDTYLKKCLKQSNRKQYAYIRNELIEHLKANNSKLKLDDISKAFNSKKKILKYIEKPELNISKDNETKKEKVDTFEDLINKINSRNIDVKNIEYRYILDILNKLRDVNEVVKGFLDMDSNYHINYIYSNLKEQNFDFYSINEDIIIAFLVGIYYRSTRYTGNMEYDEIFEEALSINRSKSIEMLKMYFKNDNNYTIGNKSGKIFKYLIEDKDVYKVCTSVVSLYYYRLPDFKSIKRYWNIENFDKNDILINYLLLKIVHNNYARQISITNEMVLVKLFEIKKIKFNKIFITNKDGHDSIEYLYNYFLMCMKDLNIMYNAFLNFKNINKNNCNIVKYEMNENKTNIVRDIVKCNDIILENAIINNQRGLLAIDESRVYGYESNLIQVFDNIEDCELRYRIFHINKKSVFKTIINKYITNIKIYIHTKKINKLIKYINKVRRKKWS